MPKADWLASQRHSEPLPVLFDLILYRGSFGCCCAAESCGRAVLSNRAVIYTIFQAFGVLGSDYSLNRGKRRTCIGYLCGTRVCFLRPPSGTRKNSNRATETSVRFSFVWIIQVGFNKIRDVCVHNIIYGGDSKRSRTQDYQISMAQGMARRMT